MKRGLLILVLGGAVGCASGSQSNDLEPLRRSVKAYNEAYRWKNFERAAAFLPRDVRLAFLSAYEDDEKSLHIDDYQIMQVRLQSEDAAEVEVRVSYTLLPSVTVQTRRVTQHWHRIGKQWILEAEDNSIRDLRAETKPQETEADPDSFGGSNADVQRDSVKVKVVDPEGRIIRDDTAAPAEPQ